MTAATPEPAIQVTDVTKRYGGILAVDRVSLTAAAGEVFGFLGPNGAGKSTIVKLVLGLASATSGNIQVLGRPAGSLEVRARIGYLPETFRFHEWLTAAQLLQFHARLARVPARRRAGRTAELLDLVGLGARANERLSTFSKGMMQRVGLAQALIGDPQLVILDEPTSALDPIGRREVRDLIRGLRRQGVTVFLNSHLLSEVERVCDRVAIINRGRVVAQGALSELLETQEVDVRAGPGAAEAARRALSAEAAASAGAAAASGEDAGRSGEAAAHDVQVTADGRLRIRAASDAQVAAVVRRLVEAGVPVYDVRPVGDSLEDLFVRVAETGDA